MAYYYPIYTENTKCQDCYKCVRQCPVKAIKIENGHAKIIEDLCILCGHCVEVCPINAKKIRNDIGRVKHLFKMKKKVIASVAPSFISEFSNVKKEQFINGLKKIGFYGVSETALGAQEVSANVSELLQKSKDKKIYISSACPVGVELIKKYYPELSDKITNLMSPVLAHCKILRKIYGEDIGIVFIGPCIAKKTESDSHPELLNIAITFKYLKKWLSDEKIILNELIPDKNDVFIPEISKEGALYPIDGGMIAGIKSNCNVYETDFMAISGINNIRNALDDINKINLKKNLFIEILACEGGCVNGPLSEKKTGTIKKRYDIIENSEYPKEQIPRKPLLNIEDKYAVKVPLKKEYTEKEIDKVLRSIGKYTEKDELNCSGCGYDSCREFAKALLDGKAEKMMCVSYMRNLAQKKANALLKSMPSGVVIVDYNLKLVECNFNFAKIIDKELEKMYELKPGLEGADLTKIVPFSDLFRKVLSSGKDILNKEIRFKKTVLFASIFNIEDNMFVGGIIQDITEPSIKKEQVVKKARQVIKKNLSTVQKIAYLLGENAADSEVTLNSIIDLFSSEPVNNSGENQKL